MPACCADVGRLKNQNKTTLPAMLYHSQLKFSLQPSVYPFGKTDSRITEFENFQTPQIQDLWANK